MARRFISIPESVEESMFMPLRRTDQVFQLDPRGARTNRSLFVSHDPEYVCANGYRLVTFDMAVWIRRSWFTRSSSFIAIILN
jgi:hypothetical protein